MVSYKKSYSTIACRAFHASVGSDILSESYSLLTGWLHTCKSYGYQGRNEGERGASNHYGCTERLLEAPKNPNKVTSTFFNTVHLLPKDLRFEHGVPNLLPAQGAI